MGWFNESWRDWVHSYSFHTFTPPPWSRSYTLDVGGNAPTNARVSINVSACEASADCTCPILSLRTPFRASSSLHWFAKCWLLRSSSSEQSSNSLSEFDSRMHGRFAPSSGATAFETWRSLECGRLAPPPETSTSEPSPVLHTSICCVARVVAIPHLYHYYCASLNFVSCSMGLYRCTLKLSEFPEDLSKTWL
jgi:hypothetical protein